MISSNQSLGKQHAPVSYSQSLCDLTSKNSENAIPTRPFINISNADRPACVSSSRPVSFCPTLTPNFRQDPSFMQPSVTSHRRFSELPIQLDTGFCFRDVTSALDRDCHYSSPDLQRTPRDVCLWSRHRGSSYVSRQSTERAISSTDDSSCTSSAFTAPTSPAVDSDGMSSICDYTVNALDFPEPPPIGSPAIRRMRSSPWFLTADDADDVLAMSGWRGRARLAALSDLKQLSHSTSPPRPWDARAVGCQGGSRWSLASAKNADLGEHTYRCDPLGFPKSQTTVEFHDRSQMSQTFLDADLGLSSRRNSTLVDVKGVSAVVSQAQVSVPRNVGDKTEAQSNPSPFGRLPRIIRKVASMRSETQRASDLMPGSIQRPVPRVRSFRFLRASEEQAPTHAHPKRESWHLNKANGSRLLIQKASDVSRPKRQSIYRQPLAGEDKFYGSNSSSRTLAPSSSCPASWKDDLNKSFIDISPERGARSKNKAPVGKGRMKSLFSKANEIFSWGRFQRKAVARGEQNS